MKKSLIFIGLGLSSIFLVQCASKKTATTGMSAEDKAKVDEIRRNYTQAQMEEGKTIAMSSCNKCHRYHEAGEYTIKKWEGILPGMITRAKLNDNDAGKVRAYLLANAKN